MQRKPLIPKQISQKLFKRPVSKQRLIEQLISDKVSIEHLLAQGITKKEIQNATSNLIRLRKKIVSAFKK